MHECAESPCILPMFMCIARARGMLPTRCKAAGHAVFSPCNFPTHLCARVRIYCRTCRPKVSKKPNHARNAFVGYMKAFDEYVMHWAIKKTAQGHLEVVALQAACCCVKQQYQSSVRKPKGIKTKKKKLGIAIDHQLNRKIVMTVWTKSWSPVVACINFACDAWTSWICILGVLRKSRQMQLH